MLGKLHKEIRETEQDNVGVESAHKSEETAETGVRLVREGYRSHKLKPYRKAAQAEQKLEKANVNALFQKSLRENPQLTSNPFSRWQQKQAIKRNTPPSAPETPPTPQKDRQGRQDGQGKGTAGRSIYYAPLKRLLLVGAIFLLICLLLNTMSSCSMMAQSIGSAISGSTYPSDDPELVAVETDYAAREAVLQAEIDNIESSHPGYDEYRYDLDMIGHDPHELAAFLSAVLQGYTQSSAQGELERVFSAQYTLTLTEEIQIRTYTDEDGDTHEYEYWILHVKLESRPISSLATELLTPDQLEMYQVYRQTLGNKPLIFGGGSTNTSDSESLDGVEFVNGTRPGNSELVELAKRQVGNVGGQPYWSWYGFNSRVEWCACFVSWCYGQMGLSEPRFAACQSQGIPWFQSHGQWGARGYDNLASGDAIFFDWDLDGSADHVGIVIGTDGSRVYTVEGNSGDACKIRSYDVNYECIKGYGLMNW
ncbi:MAG: CD1108 family mobile element protein [Faecalibacterium prausnitzii]